MTYQIFRQRPDLIWVVMRGHMTLPQADSYFQELWYALDSGPRPTDLLVDGRDMVSADSAARRRTEQVAHHPSLGHIAFVVAERHLFFAPLMRFVSGIGLFGDEDQALAYLRDIRHLPAIGGRGMPGVPRPTPPRARAIGDEGGGA